MIRTLVALSCLVPALFAQNGPPRKKPRDVGISYPIVACRMPVPPTPDRRYFPDAFNASLYVGRGTDLVLIKPDGSEELLYSPGKNGAVVDPCVSFDGRTIFFAKFDDPQDFNAARGVSKQPSHIYKIDVVTRKVTQLTFGRDTAWRDGSHKVDPQYAKHDLAPTELPDGRILFLSTRAGDHTVSNHQLPAPVFWRMNADGTNLEKMEAFSLAGCQHPFILTDGRIVWTHKNDCGRRRFGGGNYPLMVANPDLSDIKSFAGMHYADTAWHFATQLGGGDIVTAVYFHRDSFGHGALVRFPADPAHVSGNEFHPVDSDVRHHHDNHYGVNDHFRRVGEKLATPWSLGGSVINLQHNGSAVKLGDGSLAGKSTMPAAAPGGHLLFVWSSGRVSAINAPLPEGPHMKVCFMPNGTAQRRNDLVVLKESSKYHYLYPKALVPYAAIHGIARPKHIPETTNVGATTPVLPAGGPFATTGTSSLYNRESHWPPSYTDDWDHDISNYGQSNALYTVGQDTYKYDEYEIFAAQVVADMTRFDVRYKNAADGFHSHNNGKQIWGILGEIPVRKEDAGGNVLRDPNGDADTSYEVRIPANTPFHNRILDWNGLLLTSEWTWHSARPGERKNNCGGCHAHSIKEKPLPFSVTAASLPGYKIEDFALKTPLIDKGPGDKRRVTTRTEKILIVEYHRDIKPIFRNKCVPCHKGPNPKAGLELYADDAWKKLAYEKGLHVRFGGHQATRWVRKHAAVQSLLAWKVFGERLDVRKNTDRNNDVDYSGSQMPPKSHPHQLTFMEKRMIGMWIDLGCLVDKTPGKAAIDDPFDDQMPPVLTVSGVGTAFNEAPLNQLRLGVYDLHSGIDPATLSVVVTPFGGKPSANLAAGLRPKDGDVVAVKLPVLPSDAQHRVDVAITDKSGNVARRRLDLTPLSLRYSQTPWLRNQQVALSVAGAKPNEPVYWLANLAGLGRGPCYFGGTLCLDILEPFVVLGTARANAAGTAALRFQLPKDLPQLTFFTQAIAIRGLGGKASVKTRPLSAEVR